MTCIIIVIGPPRDCLQTNDNDCICELTVIVFNGYICKGVGQSTLSPENSCCLSKESSSNNSETKSFISLNNTIISKWNLIFS